MKSKIIQKTTNFILGLTFVIGVWYIAHINMQSTVMPNPFQVFAFLPNLANHNIFVHLWHSFYRVALALFFSMIAGLTFGIISAGDNIISRVTSTIIYFTYPIPRIALLPVVMLVFGLTDTSKIIMISLIVVYPIIIVVRDGVRAIPSEMYNTLTCYGSSRFQTFIFVTLPWATSSILSTLRISVGTATAVLFFTETYGTRFGMGFFIMDAWMRLSYIQMYAGIVVLSFAGFVLFILVDLCESLFLRWK